MFEDTFYHDIFLKKKLNHKNEMSIIKLIHHLLQFLCKQYCGHGLYDFMARSKQQKIVKSSLKSNFISYKREQKVK